MVVLIGRMNVLLVDDNKAMRRLVRMALQQTGVRDLRVAEAENGSDALAQLAVAVPDIILSDWSMPEMGGVDLLRELRARGSQIKFGFVTPEAPSEHMREKAFQAGAQFMIARPFSAQRLRDVLWAS
jgi:two-component system, chemotaxis family, chemotaxis protein CheY